MRQFAIVGILALLLTACTASGSTTTDNNNPSFVTATSDPVTSDNTDETTDAAAVESDTVSYDPATIALDASHTFLLPWRTGVRLRYPASWNLSESSRVTLFAPDAYNFLISGSDNPTGRLNALQALDNINQTAPIETREIDGQTVHISSIQRGNALAAAVALNETDYVLIQMLSRGGEDIERMRPFLARLGASVQVVDTPDDDSD